MTGPDDGKVTTVERGYVGDAAALGGRDDAGVDTTQWQVVVARDQFRHSKEVSRVHRFDREVSGGEIPEEPDLGLPSEPGRE